MRIDSNILDANPQLKFIGRVGAGMEHIDVSYAEAKGIEVFNSPEGNRQAVAEHALGSLLTLLSRIHLADREVRSGQWIRKANEGIEIQGKTIGIIGMTLKDSESEFKKQAKMINQGDHLGACLWKLTNIYLHPIS